MGHVRGYARVSMADSRPWVTARGLTERGVHDKWIFRHIASGARTVRLEACLQALAPGDTLVVWRLDRLGGR
jgi:DNA invertase Pin-like site-specific DNA recombinase